MVLAAGGRRKDFSGREGRLACRVRPDEHAGRGESERRSVGAHVRPGGGPAERPALLCQLLPAVPARRGDEPAAPAAAAQRRAVAAPGAPGRGGSAGPSQAGEAALPTAETGVPAEALTEAERQRHFRLRRQRDPLGEAHPCTWRTLLIKVAAEVIVRTRRIVVRLSSSWPQLGWYRRVCERVRAALPTPVPHPSGGPVGQLVAVASPGGGQGAVCRRGRCGRQFRDEPPGCPRPAALRRGL
jgi:hypothetical protein